MLLIGGELCVCDLMAIFGESQSKVSRHLAYLKHSGLVKGTRVGRWMHYSLKEPLEEVAAAQLRFMEEHLSLLPRFRQDMEKLGEVQRKKLCVGAPGRPPALTTSGRRRNIGKKQRLPSAGSK